MKSKSQKSALIWGGFIVFIILLIWTLVRLGGGASTKLVSNISEQDQIKGNPEASLQIVEYSDFQCPACKSYYPIIKQIANTYGEDVAVVYRHFPLEQIHPAAMDAALAAEAAGKQGRFWDMHDILFNTQEVWSQDEDPKAKILQYAESLRLDMDRFRSDMESSEVKKKVQDDMLSGEKSGVNSTPTFFFNNVKKSFPPNYETFKEAVEQALQGNA
ncbi:thioredoxin domain-containing protein [Candidatus Nomurabacteria bacterium]|nr:thioredoxin domain-containing protein [Candidatus Nomurabacteria bacterium]